MSFFHVDLTRGESSRVQITQQLHVETEFFIVAGNAFLETILEDLQADTLGGLDDRTRVDVLIHADRGIFRGEVFTVCHWHQVILGGKEHAFEGFVVRHGTSPKIVVHRIGNDG
ncbi:hypothetical protein D3C80_1815720 [compost metagenome]